MNRTARALGGGVLVGLFAILLCLREQQAVIQGRFWAEEGAVFYPYAGSVPAWSAIWHSYGGYLNLVANGAALLAHLAPLEQAPRVTMALGLIFQCCPAILLVFSKDRVFRSPFTRCAALVLLATPPVATEVWLQSLHSQFHLALTCGLILAFEVPLGWLFAFGIVVLFIGPLCGPGAIALLPLFGARAILQRSQRRWIQTGVLAFGSALQLLLFYHHQAGRAYGIGPVMLLCVVFIKQVTVPFAGAAVAQHASSLVAMTLQAERIPVLPICLTLSAILACLAAAWRNRSQPAIWLLAATALTTWVDYFGAFQGGGGLLVVDTGPRYAFMPQVFTSLFLLVIATGNDKPDRWIARFAVCWLIFIGLGSIVRLPGLGQDPAWIIGGPNWHDQVALWRQDHHHKIEIWPGGWFLGGPHA